MKKIFGFIKKIFSFSFDFAKKHKVVSIIILAVISAGGYFGYESLKGSKTEVRYMTAAVEKGTLISSISGVGQVSASNQADIKSTVSGEVINLNIASGQAVTSGAIIVLIDDSETQKELRDARIALENAQLDLDNLLAPPDEIDLFKAESALAATKRSLEELINPSEDDLYDAETALVTAQENLTKLKNDQAKSYKTILDAKEDAENDLVESYEDSFNLLTTVFFDLPTVITGLHNILYSYEIAESEIGIDDYQWNMSALENSYYDDRYELKKFINNAEDNYKIARENYDDIFAEYKTLTRNAKYEVIEDLLARTAITVMAMADTVKSENNLYDFWVDCRTRRNLKIFNKVTSYQSDIKTYTSKINSSLSSLLSQQRALEDTKESIIEAQEDIEEIERDQPIDLAAAERAVQEKKDALYKLKNPEQYDIDDKEIAVKEKELALEELKAGADDADIRSKKLSVQQKYEALLAVQEKLAEHSVKAPFDGVVASVNISKGDAVNSGATVGTVITDQKIVEVALNEIDIANVKTGQSATIGFDAVPDLTVTGKVIGVDALGTVTQGVVSYKIKIAFDVDDDRIKPGMTASASIIIDSKQDILLVPLSAVKAAGESSYVEILVGNQPQKRDIVIGSSNDTMIEIIEGLEEGEQIITQTISSVASQNATTPAQNSKNNLRQGADPMQGMMRMMR